MALSREVISQLSNTASAEEFKLKLMVLCSSDAALQSEDFNQLLACCDDDSASTFVSTLHDVVLHTDIFDKAISEEVLYLDWYVAKASSHSKECDVRKYVRFAVLDYFNEYFNPDGYYFYSSIGKKQQQKINALMLDVVKKLIKMKGNGITSLNSFKQRLICSMKKMKGNHV